MAYRELYNNNFFLHSIVKICAFALPSLVVFMVFPAMLMAENLGLLAPLMSPKELVESIHSVQQVKDAIQQSLEDLDECGVGSCADLYSKQICELVGAVDVKVNGKIIGSMTSIRAKPKIDISDSDLKLMKLILDQCKPTNYQYWNYESILRVSYSPSAKADGLIRKALSASHRKRKNKQYNKTKR